MQDTKVTTVDAALEYIGLGIPVFPCKPHSKQPAISGWQDAATTDKEQVIEWFEDSNYNIGIPTGKASGIIVLDADTKHGGMETLEEWKPIIPDGTPEVATPSGGKHYYFRYPYGVEIRNSVKAIGSGLDIRGDGGLVVAPPSETMVEVFKHGEKTSSLHPYRWTVELTSLVDLPELPDELLEAIQTASESRRSGGVDFGKELIAVGERNNTLASFGGKFRSLGMNHEAIKETLHNINDAQCEIPLEVYEVERIAESISKYERGKLKVEVSEKKRGINNVMELMETEFKPLEYAAYPLIPEGLTLLVGSPKIGKSWCALQLCIAVASGGYLFGKLPVDKGRVLYLALEDNERRIQNRIKALEATDGLELFDFACEWPTVDEGGAEELEDYLRENPDTKLVVVDTLKRIKDKSGQGNRNAYDIDYEAVRPLLEVAQRHSVSLVVVHHTKKQQDTDDPYRDISGSTGLTGGVDSMVYLRRERGKNSATLLYDGRDIEQPGELAIEWDNLLAGWKLVADTSEFHKLTPERRLMYEAIQKIGTASPKEVAASTGTNVDTVRHTLPKMVQTGHLINSSYGKYQVSGESVTF